MLGQVLAHVLSLDSWARSDEVRDGRGVSVRSCKVGLADVVDMIKYAHFREDSTGRYRWVS